MLLSALTKSIINKQLISLTTILFFSTLGQSQQEKGGVSYNAPDSPLPPADQPKAENLAVTLDVEPYKSKSNRKIIVTGTELTATAKINDIQKCNQTTLTTHWSTKTGPIQTTPSNATIIKYKFSKADNSTFIKINATCNEINGTATGSSQFDLVAIDPVIVGDPIGKLFLEHGELLNVKLVYNGTGPFLYCYRFCAPHDFLPCDLCLVKYETYETVIPITHYLHAIGNYTLMFYIENDANDETRHFTIKITDTVREKTLPFAPIVSSILAVLILVSGVALHLRFRKIENAETANFDFINQGQEEEDWEEEQSFIQRVRTLFFREDHEERSLIANNR